MIYSCKKRMKLYINEKRIRKNLESLGEIGFKEGQGVNRAAYSKAFCKGNKFVANLMKEAGMEAIIDPVGNVIGTKKGKSNRRIILGSHIDSVPNGGIFDGCLGVIAAIECIHSLSEKGITFDRTLQVVSFAEEEGNVVGGLLGSKAFAGLELDEHQKQNLSKVNLTMEDVYKSNNTSTPIDYYLELHIEQGGILENNKIEIGIVEGIVGICRYDVTIKGIANHAGTTPMYLRNDAMLKAAEFIIKANSIVCDTDKDMVGTVGYINAVPGACNIIPGRVDLTFEVRSVNKDSKDLVMDAILKEFPGKDFEIRKTFDQTHVLMNDEVKKAIYESSVDLGLKQMKINSGAGHDACSMAKISKSGMIFVPSKGGISHSNDEWTEWNDVANGANTLLNTILKL